MLIGVCGHIGSGKDTAANFFVKQFGFNSYSFADPLKDILSVLFSWNRTMLAGKTPEARQERDEIDFWWTERLQYDKFTPRTAMQIIGTDLFRNHFHKDIWTASLEQKLIHCMHENSIISDVRFLNEANMIKRLGGIIIKINKLSNDSNSHESELEIEKIVPDFVVDNNSTFDEFYQQLTNIHSQLLISPSV